MKRPRVNKVITVTLLVVLLAVPLIGACAKPAPAPTPATVPAPKPASAAATKADPLASIIEGAKKEGSVELVMPAGYTETEPVRTLKKNIREKYGVDLNINVTNTGGMAARMATAISEHKTGLVPTYDLMLFTTDYIPPGTKAGAFEKVDWKPLLEKGTPPEIVPQHPDLRSGIIVGSNMNGMEYNPRKISAAEVPKKIGDLADPKLKGRFGILDYASHWTRWAFILGKDRTFSTLRAIMKNKPQLGLATALNNLYLVGEVDMAFVMGTYLTDNRDKGMPTEWRNLDFVDVLEYHLLVREGARHPNAAKLVAVYLVGPDGTKYSVDVAKKGSHYYAGNYVYDIAMQARKENIPVYSLGSYPGLIDFVLSKEYDVWQKEAELILKGA